MEEKFIKLTNAAYTLLEFFPEADPLKNKAKEKVLAIMESLILASESGGWLSFKDYFSADWAKTKVRLVEDIDVVLGYFEIGKSQGWLNSMNCIIVSAEYEKIKKSLNLSVVTDNADKPNREYLITNPKNPEASKPAMKQSPPLSKITSRQSQILEFLSKNGQGQVMDFQRVLANVTKRTIRRDLDEILKIGKIDRQGDSIEALKVFIQAAWNLNDKWLRANFTIANIYGQASKIFTAYQTTSPAAKYKAYNDRIQELLAERMAKYQD